MSPLRRPLLPSPVGNAPAALVCIPHAGGGAIAFHGWQAVFGGDVEVLAVHVPGRERRMSDPPYRHIQPLAADLCDELGRLPHRSVVLFGHSVGALVAFTAARGMAQGTRPVAAIVLSGVGRPGPLDPSLPDAADDELLRRLRTLGGTPEAVLGDDEFRPLVLRTVRADLAVGATFDPLGSLVHCPTVVLVGDDDEGSEAEAVQGWADLAPNLSIHVLPGGHFFVYEHVPEVARIVQRALQQRDVAGAG